MTMDDRQLLARYVTEGSDEAFRELVRRHMGLVYSAALRQVRNPQLAQDVTQVVFANLARKARSIPAGTVLAGWLHRDTRYTALDFLRAEARRFRREQQAAAMNALNSDSPHDWKQIRPLLDEALDQLGPEDRDALLLRYFEERDFAGVGEALGASGEAARKRVDRALNRLREHLVKRGITTTAAALGAALSAHAIETVPAGFAAALAATSAAAASQAAAPATTSWLANLMLMTNTKLVVGGVLVAAALTTPLLFQQKAIARARAEQSTLLIRQREFQAQTQPAPAQIVDTGNGAPSDRADLERLRRETAAMQARISELTAQAQRTAATKLSQNSGGTPIGQTFRYADLRDAGQATPAATLQTFMWAMFHADTNRLEQLIDFDPAADTNAVRKMWEGVNKTFAEVATKGTDAMIAEQGSVTFRLLEEQPAENNDRWIVGEEVLPDGTTRDQARLRLNWSANGWRVLIGTNGEPVGGPIRDQQ